jgi:hypothetical protein
LTFWPTVLGNASEFVRLFSQESLQITEPDRIVFYGGSLILFRHEVVLKDRKNPSGVSIQRSDLHYLCNSRALTCVIAAGSHRVEVRRDDPVTYKALERSLIDLL